MPIATDSERQRSSNPRKKSYPADSGLIPAFDASGRTNLGHSLETAVLNEFERRRAEVGYVRTAEGRERHARTFPTLGRGGATYRPARFDASVLVAISFAAFHKEARSHPCDRLRLTSPQAFGPISLSCDSRDAPALGVGPSRRTSTRTLGAPLVAGT